MNPDEASALVLASMKKKHRELPYLAPTVAEVSSATWTDTLHIRADGDAVCSICNLPIAELFGITLDFHHPLHESDKCLNGYLSYWAKLSGGEKNEILKNPKLTHEICARDLLHAISMHHSLDATPEDNKRVNIVGTWLRKRLSERKFNESDMIVARESEKFELTNGDKFVGVCGWCKKPLVDRYIKHTNAHYHLKCGVARVYIERIDLESLKSLEE